MLNDVRNRCWSQRYLIEAHTEAGEEPAAATTAAVRNSVNVLNDRVEAGEESAAATSAAVGGSGSAQSERPDTVTSAAVGVSDSTHWG